MSQLQTLNSRRFTLTLRAEHPDIGERLTVLTLRRVEFAHEPIILTATELSELRALLNKWDETGTKGQITAEKE